MVTKAEIIAMVLMENKEIQREQEAARVMAEAAQNRQGVFREFLALEAQRKMAAQELRIKRVDDIVHLLKQLEQYT